MKSDRSCRSSRPRCHTSSPTARRTDVFAWYTLAGSVATALGALAGRCSTRRAAEGVVAPVRQLPDRRHSVRGASASSCASCSSRVCRPPTETRRSTAAATRRRPASALSQACIDRTRVVAPKLSALFALDSFGGGFVVQSFAAYWFYLRFGVDPGTLGRIFFWANVFAGISALVASRLATRIGLWSTRWSSRICRRTCC